MNDPTKLSRHTTWLFAFASIAAGIVASYVLSGFGQKVTAAVYFAIVAIGGFASTYLTRARVGGAVLAFLTAAAVAAIAYFFLVNHIFSAATTVASGGAATAEVTKAGATLGRTFGIFVAVIVFLETIVAGIVGAVAGSKARGQGGLAALGALAKSAR